MVRVQSVPPTAVNTPMIMNDATARVFRPDLDHPTPEEMVAPLVGLNALPLPWVEPIDISNAVLWLTSDESRYVTGVTVAVDTRFCVEVGEAPGPPMNSPRPARDPEPSSDPWSDGWE
jgi:(+)-trans-carveol dehydrogenase